MSGLDIERKVDEILANRKNSNNIAEIIKLIQSDVKSEVTCIHGLERVFISLLERNEFSVDTNLKIANNEELQIELEYVKWLQGIYKETLQIFYKLLDSSRKSAEVVLETLIRLLSAEAIHPIPSIEENKTVVKSNFPEARLQEIIKILISTKSKKKNLINCFEKYVKYKDIFFYTWKILKKIITKCQESNDIFMYNVLDILEKIPLPRPCKRNGEESGGNESLCKPEGSKEFIINDGQVQKLMNKVWQNLINRNISAVAYRKLMVTLLESFLPILDNPIYLTDFFVASVNLGGANGLLALQGIMILVQKHNIEYPNIYGRLYNMFEPNIFHTKYKSRLFYLADIFLSSTHLPENLVASFAKRVARLSLKARVPDIIISLRFIENLLLRHPGLKKLIHYHEVGQVAEDPFHPDEPDPMKTYAIESSLWEISLLKTHIYHGVSSAATFIDKNLPQMEVDLREVLDTALEETFRKETEEKVGSAMSIIRPNKIAKLSDDRLYKLWSLQS